MKRNDSLKEYFAAEVNRRRTPPLPGRYAPRKEKTRWKDDLITYVTAAAVFALILSPGMYENRLRNSYVSRERLEEFRGTIPRVVYNAAVFMQERIENKS